MQQKYKKVKTLNNTSGQGKNSFPFDEEIDKVLGHKPSINPLSTLSSVAGGSSSRSDNTLDALETKSVLSSVDSLGEESFFKRTLLQKTSLSMEARTTMHLPSYFSKEVRTRAKVEEQSRQEKKTAKVNIC